MILYFVRHGETEWNVSKKIQGKTDVPLNENGICQAKQLAKELVQKQLHVARVYTSPQLRAIQTAQIAADALGVECSSLEGLREMDLGEWEGLKWNYIEKNSEIYGKWHQNRRYIPTPGGESYNDVLKRTLNAVDLILKQETENIVAVTHSAVLMALRCYLAKRPFEEMVTYFKTKNARWVAIEAADLEEAAERFSKGE